MDRKQRKLIGEITCLTNAIIYYEVHMVVGCRLIDYFFLKILKAIISKKLKFLFSNALARRTARRLAMDVYGLIPPYCSRNGRGSIRHSSPEFAGDTPKALTHELQLISTSRFAHLCRSRPRGSIREQADALAASARGDGAESGQHESPSRRFWLRALKA